MKMALGNLPPFSLSPEEGPPANKKIIIFFVACGSVTVHIRGIPQRDEVEISHARHTQAFTPVVTCDHFTVWLLVSQRIHTQRTLTHVGTGSLENFASPKPQLKNCFQQKFV